MDISTTVDITPDKSLIKKIGMVGYKTEQAIAELIDNAIDARIKGEIESVGIDLDFKKKQITISDNGHGMDMHSLADAMTIAKESKSGESLGRFGIGMKSACSALGKRFTIHTCKTNSNVEYKVEYNENKWLSDKKMNWDNFVITQKPLSKEKQWHGAQITISDLIVPLYPNQVSKFKENFGIRYGPYLQHEQVSLRINTGYCRPLEFEVVPESRIPVDIKMSFGNHITGYLALLKKHSIKGHYGIHMFKHGRLIKAYEKFGFPAHPENSRIVGVLNVNHLPVNFAKSMFIEESTEYAEALEKFGRSDALQNVQRLSRTKNDKTASIQSVFDYFSGGPPHHISKRIRADASKNLLIVSKPFEIRIGDEYIVVSIESIKDGSLYSMTRDGGQVRIVINRDSKVFEYVKNPLFLIGIVASEVKRLVVNPSLVDVIMARNNDVESFIDEWKMEEKEPKSRDRDASVPRIGGYGLEDGLIEFHEILQERYEFKFQFTSLSTLLPYLHNMLGKIIYTLYTTTGNGEYLAELLADELDDDIAIINKPNRDQIIALMDVRTIKRIIAVREYSVISGSTVAEPEKALVDLIIDLYTHNLPLAKSELENIFDAMKLENLLDLKRFERYAKIAKKTKEAGMLLGKRVGS